MDDFVIIYHDKLQLQNWRKAIEIFLNQTLRLKTNSKTQVFPVSKKNGRSLDFLGYRIYSTHKLLRKSSVKRIKSKLKKYRKQYASGEIQFSEIKQSIQSWLGHANHADTYNLKRSLFREPFRRIYNV